MSETEKDEEFKKLLEELKAKSRRCGKCGHFHEYYIDSAEGMSNTGIGWCGLLKKDVKYSDGCERFNYRRYKNLSLLAIDKRLCEMIEELTEIRRIIKEQS